MKVKFNKFEKVAGAFVGIALLTFVFVTVAVAVKRGWFASKVRFTTTLMTADGVHPGTVVQISGLRAGSVEDVELLSASEVKVRFYVLGKFAEQIRQDSVAQVFRPFIIGEKVLEVTVGSKTQPILAAHSELPMQPSFDVMDVLSGKKLGTFISSFDRMAESVRIFAEALSDPARSRALVGMLDHMAPLIKNLNHMSLQVTKMTDTALEQNRLETMMTNLNELTENMNELTGEFKKLTPAIAEIAPDLPRTTRRAVEALDETVVTLKAMQRSWFLRGNVKDIKQEEQNKRVPANEGESN